jgi:hypothetical protein
MEPKKVSAANWPLESDGEVKGHGVPSCGYGIASVPNLRRAAASRAEVPQPSASRAEVPQPSAQSPALPFSQER